MLTPSPRMHAQVPMAEQAAAQGLPDPLPRLRRAAERDREVMEKGTRGFVSYVRGYREHQVRGSSYPCMSSAIWTLLQGFPVVWILCIAVVKHLLCRALCTAAGGV